MTDIEVLTLQEKLTTLARKWIPKLELDRWKIEVIIKRDGLSSEDEGSYSFIFLMVVPVRWQHQCASIYVNGPECIELNDDDLESRFVHELCHILVEELNEKENWRKHNERVVSHLTRIFCAPKDYLTMG